MLPPDYRMNYFTYKEGILERTPRLNERKIAIPLSNPSRSCRGIARVFRFTAEAGERRAWVRDHLLLVKWRRRAGMGGWWVANARCEPLSLGALIACRPRAKYLDYG
jgi:hypothetical protein